MAPQADRWQRIESLFNEAVELDPEQRIAFLDQNCGDDPDLRSELESLLHSSNKTSGFLDKPILDVVKRVSGAAAPGLTPGTKIQHYEILSLLGSGGMGQVYLAHDSRLLRKVAIKILAHDLTLDERGLRRVQQEARAASALNHPNILTIFEFGEADGMHYIVSEFVEGPTLRGRLAGGKLDVRTAVDIASQVAGALSAAHENGIVHRDIKPENIIIRNDGLVKVLDFGIAKLVEGFPSNSTYRTPVTQPGMVIGTLRYMSPEQARGTAVDARSDVFSLGVVLYEMLSGKPPFEGETASDLIAEILKTDPPPLADAAPGFDPQLEHIVATAISKARESRYPSAREMGAGLQAYKTELGVEDALRQRGALPTTTRRRALDLPPDGSLTGGVNLGKTARLLLLAALVALVCVGYFVVYKNRPLATSARPRSLAILPFHNLKPDPSTDFLGFSLADAVITKLGYVQSLTLRPSSSVDKYRNEVVDTRKAAAELSVDTLLTGSFIRDGDDLRITTQLVDAKLDKILWRDTIDVKYDKLLTVQDRVSQQIIKGLELNLSPAETERLQPDKSIDTVAYEDYLRGVDLYSLNDFHAGIQMLEKSAAMQPNYALTWAHLGRAYTTTASLHFGGRDMYAKAQNAYERALSLNPALIEPKIYEANLLTDTGRVEQAVPLLRAAIQTNPNNSEAHWELGYAYRFAGMLRESLAEAERSRGFDPAVKINSSALNSYLYLGEYDKFLQTLPSTNSAYIVFYRGLGEFYKKQFGPAQTNFDRAYELDPALLQAQVGKALSYAISHKQDQGLELLRKTESAIEDRGVSDAEGIYKIAQAYAALGDKPAALHMLSHAIEGGFFCLPYFQTDPLMEPLRDEPEFQKLMEQARHRHEAFRAQFF